MPFELNKIKKLLLDYYIVFIVTIYYHYCHCYCCYYDGCCCCCCFYFALKWSRGAPLNLYCQSDCNYKYSKNFFVHIIIRIGQTLYI